MGMEILEDIFDANDSVLTYNRLWARMLPARLLPVARIDIS